MEIKDTYLVVDTDTKEVFGHYDTPGKANGQVKRKGSGYAVYVVSAVEPLIKPESPKKFIEDLSLQSSLESAKKYMEIALVDDVVREAGHGYCGDDEVTEIFKYQGKYYEITVEIEWNRYDKRFYYVDGYSVTRCREVDCPE